LVETQRLGGWFSSFNAWKIMFEYQLSTHNFNYFNNTLSIGCHHGNLIDLVVIWTNDHDILVAHPSISPFGSWLYCLSWFGFEISVTSIQKWMTKISEIKEPTMVAISLHKRTTTVKSKDTVLFHILLFGRVPLGLVGDAVLLMKIDHLQQEKRMTKISEIKE